MRDGGGSYGRDQVVHAAIIYVAGADVDATDAAYVAVEHTTVNDTNTSNPKIQTKLFCRSGKDMSCA